jgi:polysaccharide biosynthesis/export protein
MPVNMATNPAGTVTTRQLPAQQPFVGMDVPHPDLAAETEAESLRRVERDIENAARNTTGGLQYNLYGQLTSYAGQTSNAQQYPNGRQDMLGAQGNYARPDAAGGTQYQPSEMQQNSSSQPQAMAQTPQQVGPYRDPRFSSEPSTLGQNLEEQPLAVGEVPTNQDVSTVSQLARQLEVDPVAVINFLRDHKVTVGGAVRAAGLYLVGPDSDVASLLEAAGGVSLWANKNAVTVVSTAIDSETGTSRTERRLVSLADGGGASYIVSPYDDVRVNQVFTDIGIGSVTIQGQVRHSGKYQIVRGDHLSDVLIRAGGLTDSAFPYGTVFLRRSAAARERDAYQREAKEIEDQLLVAMSRRDPTAKLPADAYTALQSYVSQIRMQKALGRVTIVADPAVLAANPGMDPLLEPDDVIYVPQRPYSVSILGEVLQPGSIPFGPNMSAADYIDRAGGYSQFARESDTILVLPDGSARRVESSWLDFGGDEIPPGSTIYVARDISGFDLHQIAIESLTIFSQLATTAATLAILARQ